MVLACIHPSHYLKVQAASPSWRSSSPEESSSTDLPCCLGVLSAPRKAWEACCAGEGRLDKSGRLAPALGVDLDFGGDLRESSFAEWLQKLAWALHVCRQHADSVACQCGAQVSGCATLHAMRPGVSRWPRALHAQKTCFLTGNHAAVSAIMKADQSKAPVS